MNQLLSPNVARVLYLTGKWCRWVQGKIEISGFLCRACSPSYQSSQFKCTVLSQHLLSVCLSFFLLPPQRVTRLRHVELWGYVTPDPETLSSDWRRVTAAVVPAGETQ